MSRSTFVSIAALFSLVNAVPGLIAPAAVASLYGVTIDAQTALTAQLLAGSYIGYAAMNWMTRASGDAAVRRGVSIANLVAWAISTPIWIYAAATVTTNALGWLGAASGIVFTIGWAYFVFADSRTEGRAVTATAPR